MRHPLLTGAQLLHRAAQHLEQIYLRRSQADRIEALEKHVQRLRAWAEVEALQHGPDGHCAAPPPPPDFFQQRGRAIRIAAGIDPPPT